MHHMSILHPGLHSPRSMSPPTSPPPKPVNIDPVLALQLRVRWLETLISGLRPSLGQSDPKSNDPGTATLLRKAEDLHAKLHDALDHNETCKKFLKNCKYCLRTRELSLNVVKTTSTPRCSSARHYRPMGQHQHLH